MKNIRLVIFLLPLLGLFSCVEKKSEALEKPNVLVIFPDQLRRYSAGYWSEEPYNKHVIGNPDPVVTPTIDKLAKNGVVFTNAISNYPLCSPFRGMMLTGQYPEQNGIWNNCRSGREDALKGDIKAVTDYFFEAGYNTSYFGKCHWEKTQPLFDSVGNYKGILEAPGGQLVNKYDTYVPPGPDRHSIEYFYQALMDSHFDSRVYSNDPKAIDGKSDGELHRPKIFSAKNEANHIVNYIQNTHNQRDVTKPFFMIWSLNPPHNPWDNDNTDMEMLHTYYDTNNFASIEDLAVRKNVNLEVAHYARHYFANVTSVDKYVGVVLDELEKQGILENTIVIFTSDHGEMLGSHDKTGKNVMETEAIAIPFIVHYPAKIKPGISGSLLGAIDILPTLMGLSNLSDKIADNVKGRNFTSELLNPKEESSIENVALLMLSSQRGIYNKDYTFCIEEDKKNDKIKDVYLYDNIADPYQNNRIERDEKPEVIKQMLVTLGNKLKEANDPWYKQRKYNDFIVYPD